MIVFDIAISFLFFCALPILVILKLNERLRKHFSAIILVNFIIFKAIFFFGAPLIGIDFIEGAGGIVWSFIAYWYLKKQFEKKSESVQAPSDSDNPSSVQ